MLAHPLIPLDLPARRPVAAEGDTAAPQLLGADAAAGAGAAAVHTPGGCQLVDTVEIKNYLKIA